jgi:hypothetical protein
MYLGMIICLPTKSPHLTSEEKEELTMLARRPKSAVAMRAQLCSVAAKDRTI